MAKKKKAKKSTSTLPSYKPVEGGWLNKGIKGGFSRGDERKYRAKKGRTDLIRFLDNEPVTFFVHRVDDVAVDSNGDEVTFNSTCALRWDPEDEDWVGECLACDREYDRVPRYAARILHIASRSDTGKKWTVLPPEESPKLWDFGGDKFEKVSDIASECEEAEEPTSLSQIEVVIKCKDDTFQKVDLARSLRKRMTTKEHLAAFKEQRESLLKAIEAPSPEEQARNLRPRGKRRASAKAKGKAPEKEERKDEDDDAFLTDDEELNALLRDM